MKILFAKKIFRRPACFFHSQMAYNNGVFIENGPMISRKSLPINSNPIQLRKVLGYNYKEDRDDEKLGLPLDRQHIENIVCCDVVLPISLQATCSSVAIVIKNLFSGIIYHRTRLSAEPKCVSLHPFGINVLIGFDEEWQVFINLHDKLEEVNVCEEPNLSLVCFSPSGGLIAVVAHNIIRLLDSITFNQVITFEYLNPKVEKIIWRGDYHILAASEIGVFREWKIPQVERIWKYSIDGEVAITALTIYLDIIFVSTCDGQIRKFNNEYQEVMRVTLDKVATAMVVWKDILVTGSREGILTGLGMQLEEIIFKERCHQGQILYIAANDDVFVAVGVDGLTSFWSHANNENITSPLEDDAVLIHIDEHKKLVNKISKMEATLKSRMEIANKKRTKQEKDHESDLQEIAKNYRNIEDSLKSTINDLVEELQCIQSEQESILEDKIIAIRNEIEEKEEYFLKKISEAKERYQTTLDEKEQIEKYYERMIGEKHQDIKDSTERFGDRYRSFKESLLNIKAAIRKENDLQKAIDEEREKFLAEWAAEKWTVFVGTVSERKQKEDFKSQQSQLESEMGEVQRQLLQEKKHGLDLDEEVRAKSDEHAVLLSKLDDIKLRINQTHEDISRLERITNEYHDGNDNLLHDLVALKAAGDMRLPEYEKELEIKRKELDDVKKELLMNEEKYKSLAKNLKKLKEEECNLVERLKTTKKSVYDSMQQLMRAELLLERYRSEFIECTSDLPSAYALRWAIIRLYDKRVVKNQKIKEEDLEVDETDPSIRFCKQRDHYEDLINVVQSRTIQIKETYRKSFLKLAQENSDWTAFAESIRDDIKNKKERIKCLEEALGLKAHEFPTNSAETRRRLDEVAKKVQQLEEKEWNAIEKRMRLIQEQASEILRLHALLNVEERNKISRREVM